ncbi:MAG: ribosome maturation factor RimP [Ruminococcus sp.]|nr:ribosome maturation factor RimP [Ruminococcus sp.]
MNTADKVRAMVQPICDELELFLWDVRFEKEGATWYLKVLIDKDGGVTIDDCERATKPISDLLDEKDPISQSYVLEVGSPGLGRELRLPEHFIVCIGDEVRVRTIRPVNGEREFIGILYSYDKNEFVIAQSEDEADRLTFKTSDCAYVKLNDDQF